MTFHFSSPESFPCQVALIKIKYCGTVLAWFPMEFGYHSGKVEQPWVNLEHCENRSVGDIHTGGQHGQPKLKKTIYMIWSLFMFVLWRNYVLIDVQCSYQFQNMLYNISVYQISWKGGGTYMLELEPEERTFHATYISHSGLCSTNISRHVVSSTWGDTMCIFMFWFLVLGE